KQIRVLTVIRHPVGGIRTYLKYTYRYLDRNIYRFTFILPRNPEVGVLRCDLRGFDTEWIQVEGPRLTWELLRQTRRTLSECRHDLIQSHGFTSGVLSILANMGIDTPHLVTSHDVFRADQFAPPWGRMKRLILGALLSRADVIQNVTEDARSN